MLGVGGQVCSLVLTLSASTFEACPRAPAPNNVYHSLSHADQMFPNSGVHTWEEITGNLLREILSRALRFQLSCVSHFEDSPPAPHLKVERSFVSLQVFREASVPNIEMGGQGAGASRRAWCLSKMFSRYFFPGMDTKLRKHPACP